ncbi:hypothetical protein BOX15_Mlig024067g1 [Macrostomum lignano]|uniref:Nucleotide-diphospho-sugar transferase domain-containing protein n=2 Tax=Macrostomum lignano TaxID=282301 RepID=A0A267F8M0_9PLAT|nr:hypothetical protein BOX15_Mlig024067g1 [Macrostomum lignano]
MPKEFRFLSGLKLATAALIICITATVLITRMHHKKLKLLYWYADSTISSINSSTAERTLLNWALHRNASQSREILRHLFETGVFLELAKAVKPMYTVAPLLSEYYPDRLSLAGHQFRTMDDRELSAYRIVSAIRASSSKLQPIPNAVHFFLFYPRQRYVELEFHHYVALLSAAWLSGTDFVILWCSAMPDGHYWHQLKSNLTAHGKQNQLLLATRPLPKRVFNRNVRVIEHQVDVMKLETGITIGGIILDTDVLTLRSLQPLRRFDCVIGRESSIGLTIGAFMTKPRDIFLMLWYMLYQTFDDGQWAQHSVLLPQQI